MTTVSSVRSIQAVLDEHRPAGGTHTGHVCCCGAVVAARTDQRRAWDRHRAEMLAAEGFEPTVNGIHPGTLDQIARQVREAFPDAAEQLAMQAAALRGAAR